MSTTTTQPRRVQLSRKKGWRLPANTVVVSRPSKWGNPFKVGPSLKRGEAVELFRALIERDHKTLRKMPWTAGVLLTWAHEHWTPENIRRELGGKNLACWCGEGPCHADVLLELANAPGGRDGK